MRYISILLLFICVTQYALAFKNERKQDILLLQNNIKNLIETQKLPKNTKSDSIKCQLTQNEQNLAKLTYPQTFYEYYNALLETNRVDINTTKLTQDLLIESARHHNTPSFLLALQLYFSKQCERCDRIRDLSMFDYYRDKNADMQKILFVEGGNFEKSYALLGEAFLCRALSRKSKRDYLMAYSNLMLAGLHTRAINILLQGIKDTNDDVLYATLQFLVSFDNVIAKSEASAYFLRILRTQEKNSFINIMKLPYFKNLKVLEYDIASNFILQILLVRDMEMGRILSPFDILANQQTKIEFWDKMRHYKQIIQAGNDNIMQHAKPQDLNTYLKILQLKNRLKSVSSYPFATTYEN